MKVGVSEVLGSPDDAEFVVRAERVGATSVWVAEAWGYDALTPLAHLAALPSTIDLATRIAQVGARRPAMLAMQAMSVAFARQGFGDDVEAVRQLWDAGRREEAAARVPIEIGLCTNLLGPAATITARVRRYRAAGIDTLQAKVSGSLDERIDTVAQLVEIVAEVEAEAEAETGTETVGG